MLTIYNYIDNSESGEAGEANPFKVMRLVLCGSFTRTGGGVER
jgi:hypothetical protein